MSSKTFLGSKVALFVIYVLKLSNVDSMQQRKTDE